MTFEWPVSKILLQVFGEETFLQMDRLGGDMSANGLGCLEKKTVGVGGVLGEFIDLIFLKKYLGKNSYVID